MSGTHAPDVKKTARARERVPSIFCRLCETCNATDGGDDETRRHARPDDVTSTFATQSDDDTPPVMPWQADVVNVAVNDLVRCSSDLVRGR